MIVASFDYAIGNPTRIGQASQVSDVVLAIIT